MADRPLLDPRRHQPRASAPPAATAQRPFRMPPGGRGHANAGVMAVVLPTATPAHLLDMIEIMRREADAMTGAP